MVALPNTHLLYLFLTLLVALPSINALEFTDALASAWCSDFGLPDYEKAFDFRLGTFIIDDDTGGTREVIGLVWVEPNGPLWRSGLRFGDVPRMYHGVGDLCGALAQALEGSPVEIEVDNVDTLDSAAPSSRRITITR